MSNPSKKARRPHGSAGAGRTNKKDAARAAALSASSGIVRPGSATERLINAQPRGVRPQGDRGDGGQKSSQTEVGDKQPVVSTYVPKPRQPVMTVRLDQIRQVLDEVLTWRFAADSIVSHWFRAHPKLGIRDRAEVAEVVYDVLRHLRRYRQLGESGVGNAVRRLAIQGAISVMQKKFVLCWIRVSWHGSIGSAKLKNNLCHYKCVQACRTGCLSASNKCPILKP
jgi:16S rRNA (cytosine967-C5)-methyltransferase